MESLDQVVNLKVKITNLLDESISGTIYAFSLKQRVLALEISPSPTVKPVQAASPEKLYKIINTAFIKSISVLPPYPKKHQRPNEHSGYIPKLEVKKLESRLNQVLAKSSKSTLKQASPPPQPQPGVPGVKKSESLAAKVYEKLTSKLGKENVQWHQNDLILLFKEVAVSKPYALNKISNSKRTQSSRHLETAKAALREVWLADDNLKKGG